MAINLKTMMKALIDSNLYKIAIKPSLNIATAGYYDIIDQLSQSILKDRKQEFLKFISENIDLLDNPEVYNDKDFISGLVTLYEFTMRQRFEQKRFRAFGIFLGFVNSNDKITFELERMYATLNLMTIKDIKLCLEMPEWQWYPAVKLGNHSNVSNEFTTSHFPLLQEMWHLINLGILFAANTNNTYVLSEFGKNFIKELRNT